MRSRGISGFATAKSRSGGASIAGIILSLTGLVVVITLALRLGPHYMDWRTMNTVFENLHRQPIQDMSKTKIREAVAKGFRINSLRDFDLKNMLVINADKEKTILTVSYEQREHIAMNVDVVLTFSKSYQYP